MFDFLGNMREQQEAMQKQLSEIIIEEISEGGAVKVIIDANRRVRDIVIDSSKIDMSDTEQLQDLLVLTLNAAVEKAEIKADAEMRKSLDNMLPGGLDQLFGG